MKAWRNGYEIDIFSQLELDFVLDSIILIIVIDFK